MTVIEVKELIHQYIDYLTFEELMQHLHSKGLTFEELGYGVHCYMKEKGIEKISAYTN